MRNLKDITYVDLRLDFAFKRVFGTPGHEKQLLKLVNAILPEEGFTSVRLSTNERVGLRRDSRRAVFDIFATTSDGSDVTIEMQYGEQADFNQRMVFYSSFPIQNHVKRGKSGEIEPHLYYAFPHVYVIGITDFILPGVPNNPDIVNKYTIRNENRPDRCLTDKVTYVTVELPKLTKSLEELETPADFMFYALRNIWHMKQMPEEYKNQDFDNLFELCKFAAMKESEQRRYVAELMAELDEGSRMATAINKGLALGREEGYKESAKNMKQMGLPLETICQATGLSKEAVEAL